MHGMLIFHAASRDGDTVTVRKMLSTAGAQSMINYKDASGDTPLYCAAANGHASVTEQLIEVRPKP
jgi:ankyrin repeat protein